MGGFHIVAAVQLQLAPLSNGCSVGGRGRGGGMEGRGVMDTWEALEQWIVGFEVELKQYI